MPQTLSLIHILTRENGEFIVNPGQTGCSVNVDESTAKVVNYPVSYTHLDVYKRQADCEYPL